MAYKKRSAYIKLLPSVLCIAVTLFAGIAASMAWFSLNENVDASGMKVTMNTADPYLVIAETETKLQNANSSNISVDYSDPNSHPYVPVTHDDDAEPHLLQYATSGDNIDPNTGWSADLTFTPVPQEIPSGEFYFADFTVYVGALYCDMTGTDLIADWSDSSLAAAATDRQKAASIDFYVKNGEAFSYVTSTNLASGKSVTLLSNDVVPHCKSGSICIRMRFYFDGALTYVDPDTGDTIAYIRTADVVSSEVNLGITFRAEPHQTP